MNEKDLTMDNIRFITDNIFEIPVKEPFSFIKDKNKFIHPFSDLIIDDIVKYHMDKGRITEVKGNLRLNDIKTTKEGTTFYISPAIFNDFLSTNLLLLDNPSEDKEVVDKVLQWKQYNDYKSVLKDKSLSNVITVSVLIHDEENNTGIVHRTEKVAVSPGYYGTTMTGTPDEDDYDADDPLKECVIRELKEELNIDTFKEMEFKGFVIGREKLQPVALYDITLNGLWSDHMKQIKSAEDYAFENEELLIYSYNDLFDTIKTHKYTVIARYHIAKYFNIV